MQKTKHRIYLSNMTRALGIPFFIILFLIQTFCTSWCRASNKEPYTAVGLFSIENDNIPDDIHPIYTKSDEVSYILIKGQLPNFPIPKNSKRINTLDLLGTFRVSEINGATFNRPKPQGDIRIKNDNSVTFSLKIHSSAIKASNFRKLTDTLLLACRYSFSGDTTSYPFTIIATSNPNEKVIYSRLASGSIEKELGLTIEKAVIKGLTLDHYDYYNGNTPKKLAQYDQLETLYIQGLVIDMPFPEEVYSLPKLKHITYTFSKRNFDKVTRIHTGKFFLPAKVFQLPSIQSILIDGNAINLNIPHVPTGCKLEQFKIYGYCKVDSLPHSFSNLTNLRAVVFAMNQIMSPLPDGLNKLELLDTVVINIPDAYIPNDFGPWEHASHVRILQTNNLKISNKEFEARRASNLPKLLSAFPNASAIRIDRKEY